MCSLHVSETWDGNVCCIEEMCERYTMLDSTTFKLNKSLCAILSLVLLHMGTVL